MVRPPEEAGVVDSSRGSESVRAPSRYSSFGRRGGLGRRHLGSDSPQRTSPSLSSCRRHPAADKEDFTFRVGEDNTGKKVMKISHSELVKITQERK